MFTFIDIQILDSFIIPCKHIIKTKEVPNWNAVDQLVNKIEMSFIRKTAFAPGRSNGRSLYVWSLKSFYYCCLY